MPGSEPHAGSSAGEQPVSDSCPACKRPVPHSRDYPGSRKITQGCHVQVQLWLRDSLVREACASLGHADKAEQHLAYLDREYIVDLTSLTPELWSQLDMPLGLKATLQRRLAVPTATAVAIPTATAASSSGAAASSSDADRPAARSDEDEKEALSVPLGADVAPETRAQLRWTRVLLALSAKSQIETTVPNLEKRRNRRRKQQDILAQLRAEASASGAAAAYMEIFGDDGLPPMRHLRRALQDLIVWRSYETCGGFGDKKALVDTFKVAFQPRVLDLDVLGIHY